MQESCKLVHYSWYFVLIPGMSKLQYEDAIWPLMVFVFIMGVALWSTTIIPTGIPTHKVRGHEASIVQQQGLESVDCDVCAVVYMGDGDRNLPFSLLPKLLRMIKNLAQEDRNVVCVGVDHPAIACRMVRDALGPDANCWPFSQMPKLESPMRCNHMVVGKTSGYLPQFQNQTTAGRFVSQQLHIVDLDATDEPAPKPTNIRPTIVTGFSANHLSTGLLLLRSIAKAASTAKETNSTFTLSIVVWEMEEFRGQDREHFQCIIKEMQETWDQDVEVRIFKFWQYPKWMRIKPTRAAFDETGNGEYAWKVVMIHTILRERGLVLWVDAGDRFKTSISLTSTLSWIAEHGFASRASSGILSQWTHEGTLRYLRVATSDPIVKGQNCDGSAVGFSMEKYEELAKPWYECAVTRQCIAPNGSNRSNHRQDQAALTVLAALSGNACGGVEEGVGRHMDYDLADVVGAAPSSCYHDPRR